MNTPTTPHRAHLRITLILTLTATVMTGCSSEPPAPLPVHAEVEWDNDSGPSGPFEDDPRVQAVRDYLVWSNASTNALNYSSPQLDQVATFQKIGDDFRLTIDRIKGDDLVLHQGPSRFHVTTVDDTYPDHLVVQGCFWPAPAWTRHVEDKPWLEHTDLGDGIYQRTYNKPYQVQYRLVEEDGHWKVDSRGGGNPCDAGIGDAPTGVYTTPPDLDLLTDASSDMIIDMFGINYIEE